MKTIAEQLNHDFKKGTLHLYNSNGNRIYREASNGYWAKREFDPNGNEIYYENSYGYWCKREYDPADNEIYFENSDGYWIKREYDSNGNEIYYEDSTGYIEDNRPKPSCEGKIVEVDGEIYKLVKLNK